MAFPLTGKFSSNNHPCIVNELFSSALKSAQRLEHKSPEQRLEQESSQRSTRAKSRGKIAKNAEGKKFRLGVLQAHAQQGLRSSMMDPIHVQLVEACHNHQHIAEDIGNFLHEMLSLGLTPRRYEDRKE